MVDVSLQKCACPDCVCVVRMDEAVKKGDHNYCSEACAQGHPKGPGCHHSGCSCKG